MGFFIVLALLNGAFITSSRAMNGRLSLSRGPFLASLWNHWVGFIGLSLGLSLIVLFSGLSGSIMPSEVPFYAYLGGAIGALYVAVNSYVLPRLGSLSATLLVISGQMLAGLVIDWMTIDTTPLSLHTVGLQVTGVFLIMLGILMSQSRPAPKARPA